MEAMITAVCLSERKGNRKVNTGQGKLEVGRGLAGDAHNLGPGRQPWHRQVSLLAEESIAKMRALGLSVGPGNFAENLTTEGLDLLNLPIGCRLRVGSTVLLEVTQIGKVCHSRCAIYFQAGDCVMPKEGVFARVLVGGPVQPGDPILVLNEEGYHA